MRTRLGMWACLLLGVATLAASSPGIQSEPPYPPSPVIQGVNWDFEHLIRLANTPGKGGSDLWPTTWAADGNIYTGWGDGGGFSGASDYRGAAPAYQAPTSTMLVPARCGQPKPRWPSRFLLTPVAGASLMSSTMPASDALLLPFRRHCSTGESSWLSSQSRNAVTARGSSCVPEQRPNSVSASLTVQGFL